MFNLILYLLFGLSAAHAQQVTCATRPAGDSTNACASTAFVNGGSGNVIPVPGGGTGDGTFTPNLPLIGNGTGPIAQGTRSGNTTIFTTTNGALINGHCVSIDSNGNLVDAGGACGTGTGSGTVTSGTAGQIAYYPANGASVSGSSFPPPIPNVSGSTATSTGTINSVTSAGDWINGEGILIPGAGATFTGAQPTSFSYTRYGASGSTTYTYTAACVDSSGGEGIAPAGVSNPNGYATLDLTNYNKVSWTAGSGCRRYAVYGRTAGSMQFLGMTDSTQFYDYGGSYGPPTFISNTPPVAATNDWLLTTISSGGGSTTLTLGASATNSVASVTIYHEDHAALQAAINALPANGGVIRLPAAIMNLARGLTIGNGTGSAASTTTGVIFLGANSGNTGLGYSPYGTVQGAAFNWIGTANDALIQYNGGLVGWGVQNLTFNCNQATYGLLLYSVEFGDSKNLAFNGCRFSIISTTQDGVAAINSMHNKFETIFINPLNYNQSYGVRFDGTATANTCYTNFTNILINATSNAATFGMVFISTDTDIVYGYHASGNWAQASGSALVFDYADAISTNYPASNTFFGVDPGGSGILTIVNNGSPGGTFPNIIYGLTNANGGTCPSLSNFYCHNN